MTMTTEERAEKINLCKAAELLIGAAVEAAQEAHKEAALRKEESDEDAQLKSEHDAEHDAMRRMLGGLMGVLAGKAPPADIGFAELQDAYKEALVLAGRLRTIATTETRVVIEEQSFSTIKELSEFTMKLKHQRDSAQRELARLQNATPAQSEPANAVLERESA